MQDFLTWSALVGAGGSITVVITFWMKIGGKLAKADAAERMASVALGKADLVSAQLSEYKVEATRLFASGQALASAEIRLSAAIEGMHARFDRMAERLDRVLEVMVERRDDK